MHRASYCNIYIYMLSIFTKHLKIEAVLLVSANACHPSGDQYAKKYKLNVEHRHTSICIRHKYEP